MIMWDNASVAKSTGGVRLVGPEARMSERGRGGESEGLVRVYI